MVMEGTDIFKAIKAIVNMGGSCKLRRDYVLVDVGSSKELAEVLTSHGFTVNWCRVGLVKKIEFRAP